MDSTTIRIRWAIFAVFACAAVVAGTVWPDSTVNTANFVPLREHARALGCVLTWCDTALASMRFAVVDVVGNVVVFIPIGMAFAGMLPGTDRRRLWSAVAMGFILSLAIEIGQSVIPT
ncbi:MAG: VanZ family protein, partial [Acidimicrobiia bacterium]|nr:VanZ family protein [Acidimicrobiia bacterium]